MAAEKTLFPELENVTSHEDIDPRVRDFIQVYDDFQIVYTNQLREREFLDNLTDSVANTDDPTKSNRRTNQSMLFKVRQNILKQADIPSFMMQCGGMTENQRMLTQALFEDALEKAGWGRVLMGKKNGALPEYIGRGFSIIGFGTNPSGKFPFTYWNGTSTMFGCNVDANQFVNPGSEMAVRKFVIIKEYQTSQLIAMHPELDGKIQEGVIPGLAMDMYYRNRKTELQRVAVMAHRTQVAYCYDIDYLAKDGTRGLYMEVVGSNAYIKKELEGKAYPWRDRDDNADIPYDMPTCFARMRGLIDYGMENLVMKIGVIHTTLKNMGITYTLSNSNPIRIVSTSMTETEFAQSAKRAIARGNNGQIPIMLNKDGKEFGGVTTLSTQPIINEMNGMLEILEKDLMQMGINLNDIATDTTKTLGALQLEVAASTAAVKYIQKSNAFVFERLLQMFVQALVERKRDDSDIVLVPNMNKYQLRNGGGKLVKVTGVPEIDQTGAAVVDKMGNVKTARNWTLEDLKEQLRAYGEVDIEVSGGVQNNPVLEDAIAKDIMATSDPTSRASLTTRALRARRMGFNFEAEDFMPGSGMPQQQMQPQVQAQQPQSQEQLV